MHARFILSVIMGNELSEESIRMNQALTLKVLSSIMNWDDGRSRHEFAWLRLMSHLKYDSYQDYLAGARFIESLADWLQQFDAADRETAYGFVRSHLVFISAAEMQHLIDLTYPETVQPELQRIVASTLGIPSYTVWANKEATSAFELLKRKTLFLGLSDGARVDAFRRANVGVLSNEQIVVATEINEKKWESLVKDLREETDDSSARFALIFLLDDFVASGTTLLKFKEQKWSGKLIKFWDATRSVMASHVDANACVYVHHYIATHKASEAVGRNYDAALEALGDGNLFSNVKFTFGVVMPKGLPIDEERYSDFMKLVERYYDPEIETKSIKVGGEDARLGFSQCALPLVLDHNTPNNSVALLWAESNGNNGRHVMRPLFRRRQRHS